MWYKLTKKNIESKILCDKIENCDCVDNLQKMIKAFEFVEFHTFDIDCPVGYALTHDNLRLLYSNPYQKPNVKKYGYKNPFEYPFYDHAMYFRTAKKQIFLILNPYLSDIEIKEYMDRKDWKNTFYFGDYSKIKYLVLGKDRSYHNPHKSNLVILYMGNDLCEKRLITD